MKTTFNHGSFTTEEARRYALAKHWSKIHQQRLTSHFNTVREASEIALKEIYARYPDLKPEEKDDHWA